MSTAHSTVKTMLPEPPPVSMMFATGQFCDWARHFFNNRVKRRCDPMTFQEAVSALRDFGFPGGLLIALCYAGWKWGWYVLDEILKPASHKFIAFMEHLMAAVTKLTDSSERVCDQMKQQSDQISNHGEQLTLHGKTLEEIRGMLKK